MFTCFLFFFKYDDGYEGDEVHFPDFNSQLYSLGFMPFWSSGGLLITKLIQKVDPWPWDLLLLLISMYWLIPPLGLCRYIFDPRRWVSAAFRNRLPLLAFVFRNYCYHHVIVLLFGRYLFVCLFSSIVNVRVYKTILMFQVMLSH